jgi:hypothetical protein
MAKAKAAVEVLQVSLTMARLEFCILGTTPFIHHAMSEKARKELLIPSEKSKAARALRLKHDVIEEYKSSPYVVDDPKSPTRTVVPAVSFKRVLESMSLDVPGMTKSVITRNVVAAGHMLPLFGVPELKMDVVRSADMARTPDIRTRAVVREWATKIVLQFPSPLLNQKVVTDLLGLGGMLRGVGDYRPEKGAGDYGTFVIVPESDANYQRILKTGGREAQIAALENPNPPLYDEETEKLYLHFVQEVEARGKEAMLASNSKKPKKEAAAA